MAHIFWSSCITLAKRSGLFSQLAIEIPHDKKEDVEFLWRAWIQEEVAKRLAQIMFAVDVERELLLCRLLIQIPASDPCRFRSHHQKTRRSSDTPTRSRRFKCNCNCRVTRTCGTHPMRSSGNAYTTRRGRLFNSSRLSRRA